MNWNKRMRQFHRWLSMIFLAAVVLNGVEVVRGKYTNSLGLAAVVPMVFLLITGLYLFVLPYTVKWRSARRAS